MSSTVTLTTEGFPPAQRHLAGLMVTVFLVSAPTAHAGDTLFLLGAGYDTPTKLGLSAGLVAGPSSSSNVGFSAEAQAGAAGGRVSAGIIFVGLIGDGVGDSGIGFGLPLTLSLRPTLVRTWGSPVGVEAGETLAGVEVEGSVALMLRVRVGFFAHHDATIVTWGVSVGFGFD